MPVKDSHTRIKPLALAVTPERAPVSVEERPLRITHNFYKPVNLFQVQPPTSHNTRSSLEVELGVMPVIIKIPTPEY
jgi:hypothetical protein